MPFRTALSGLNATSTELRVIGNNVANSSTMGFKKSRTEFADIYATSNLGSSENTVGSGVRVGTIAQEFSQGNIEFTNNFLDLAVSGQGFFRLSDNGSTVFSRNGGFNADRDGYITNSSGQRLTGYQADSTGNITGALGDIHLDAANIAPKSTQAITLGLNMDAGASVPAAPLATSLFTLGSAGANPILDTGDSPVSLSAGTLVDSYGNAITTGTLQFTHVSGNQWSVDMTGAGGATTAGTFTIGTDSTASFTWDPDGSAGSQSAQTITMDVTALTQAAGGGTTDLTATPNGSQQGAFSTTDASTYNNSTSMSLYDSQGSTHLATFYYRKTGIPNQWEAYTYIDGKQVPGGQTNGSDLLEFTTDGALSKINGAVTPPSSISVAGFSPSGAASTMTFTMDYAGTTQFGGGFDVNSLSQDGYTTGRLSGVNIDSTGVVQARFSNGQTRNLAQVALARFANDQGLSQLGDNAWAESYGSGTPIVGTPGSSSLGMIQSGALEGSNVDLTEELVTMITAQRNFQANAQVISTADTITQSIINLR
ncbi:MAG: flagellar hook-basal body complex protein [Gammaproteobacteria bacterium]|nr:flagellar hook-basal body complex protein [Gammaproteobacteria bacterium]